MKYFFIFLFVFLLNNKSAYPIDTKASQAIVIDFNTSEVLYKKKSELNTIPASMTKIMTVYVVFDRIKNSNLSLEDICTVSPKSYKMGGSKMFLEINDKVSILDLLKGIIIHSGNDASVAISECLSGTEESFAELMNIYGKKMNLMNTNFVNSSGWPNENHYSTVEDIAIISNNLIRDFPELYKLFKETEYEYNNIKQPNRNFLLSNLIGTDGLKTGFTKKSGWGIALSTQRNNRRVTVVINGSNSSRERALEAEKLTNWAFRETNETILFKKNEIIKTVDVWLGSKSRINLIIENDVKTILSYEQIKSISSEIEYTKPIPAPLKKGDKLGEINISINGKDNMIIPLVSDKNVNSINPLFRIFFAAKYLIFGNSLNE